MTPSLESIMCCNNLQNFRETFVLSAYFIIKNMMKYTDGYADEEIHRVRSGRVPRHELLPP